MMTNEPLAVKVETLRMSYGSKVVLHDVTFQVRQGEVLCFLGPNGAGKSTTIEILEGFRMRSGGRAEVLGTDPAYGNEQWRARLGIVLQSWRDHAKWRVYELLHHLGTHYTPYSTPQIERPWNTDELVAAVGLTDQANQKIGRLSGGQRRRFDVAVGLVGRPDLLFLDEPTAGLDPEARRDFHDLVRQLVARGGTTILLTTHDLNEAEHLADCIVILDGGRIVADGTAQELAQSIVAEDEVRWTRDGQQFVRSTSESTKFVLELFRQHGENITDLEVRRSSLENTYLALVQQAESGKHRGMQPKTSTLEVKS